MDQATARLGSERVGKLLLDYSIPAVIGMVMASLYNIVDRIFIGQGVGPLAISGLALTFPLMTLVMAIGTLVGVGASARISIVLGMNDVRWARNILGNAFVLTFLFSAVLITFSMLYLDDILLAFGGSAQTIPYAKDYLRIVIPGSVLSNLSYSFSGVMRATGYPRKSMYTILIGVGLNVILDPVFIFGLNMGIEGAAVATVISMFVSMLFVMSHFFNTKHQVHFRVGCFRPKVRIIRNIVSIGMAPFLMNLAASVVNIIMNNQLVREGGDLAIGAFGIINSFGMLIVMCVLGLCQGMQPIVGFNYGAGQHKRVQDTLWLVIITSTVIMGIGCLCSVLFPEIIARAFTNDPELIEVTANGLRISLLVFVVVGSQISISQFFQSIGIAWKAMFLSLSRQCLFLIPALLTFPHVWGLDGVWYASPFSDFIAAVTAWGFLWYHVKNIKSKGIN